MPTKIEPRSSAASIGSCVQTLLQKLLQNARLVSVLGKKHCNYVEHVLYDVALSAYLG